jgi:hypothetical protein
MKPGVRWGVCDSELGGSYGVGGGEERRAERRGNQGFGRRRWALAVLLVVTLPTPPPLLVPRHFPPFSFFRPRLPSSALRFADAAGRERVERILDKAACIVCVCRGVAATLELLRPPAESPLLGPICDKLAKLKLAGDPPAPPL